MTFTTVKTVGGGCAHIDTSGRGFILDSRHLRGTAGGFWIHWHGDRATRDLSEKLIGIRKTLRAAKKLLARTAGGATFTYLPYSETGTHFVNPTN